MLTGEFNEQRDADGGDQHGETGRWRNGHVREKFDQHSDDGADDGGEDDDEKRRDDGGRRSGFLQGRSEEVGGERAEHQHVAMGEVDEAQDAINHRVAQRDERVDESQRQTVDQLLEQPIHAVAESRIDGVHQLELPSLTCRMTMGLVASRLASIVILPLTPSKSLRLAGGVPDFGRVGAAGAGDGGGQHLYRVMTEHRHGIGSFAVELFPVGGHEVRNLVAGRIGRAMGGNKCLPPHPCRS